MSENNVDKAPRYMGFWARVLASVIDSILLLIVLLPIVFLLFGDEVMENQRASWIPFPICCLTTCFPFAPFSVSGL